MKLLRYQVGGVVRPGLLHDDGTIRDLGAVVPDIDAAALTPDGLAEIRAIDAGSLPIVSAGVRLVEPVADPQKLVCIGLNYADHAAEAGLAVPSEPIIFMKAPTALTGPSGPVFKPPHATRLDWEVELCIVIGSRASYVDEGAALDHVAGYTLGNDISEREFQLDRPAGQWTKGKSGDRFAPIGPWMVTADEVPKPENLRIWLKLNGETMQDGSTSKLVFGIAQIVSFVSHYLTLLPGDIIMTGTPPGVGMGMKPPRYLEVGDVMELGIEGLGTQRQEVLAHPAGG